MQQGSGYGRDHNPVFNIGDTRRGPDGVLRCLFLHIGTDRPTEDDLAALHFDRDTPGVRLCIADERFLDLLLQVGGRHTRPDHNEIGDAFDHGQALNGTLCVSLLEGVVNLALERYPAVAVSRDRCFPVEAPSAALARSASVRSAEVGRRTSMSLATALTPGTRCAASSAAIFFK